VAFACDALGIDPFADDGRALTVTGGLPYHGGPGSCYVLHSLVTMADVLRADPGSYGLVSGVGMHMTKHAFAVWSTEPGPGSLQPPDQVGLQAELDVSHPPPPITPTATGPATMTMYSVVHDRSGEAEWGLAVCDLPDSSRTYARVEDPAALASLESTEWVGHPVTLTPHPTKAAVNLLRA